MAYAFLAPIIAVYEPEAGCMVVGETGGAFKASSGTAMLMGLSKS